MFKVGQKLVCVFMDVTNPYFTGIIKKGDIVTYEGLHPYDNYHIVLAEDHTCNEFGSRAGYDPTRFRPLVSDAKTELIEKFIEVVESPDCPIQTPQNV